MTINFSNHLYSNTSGGPFRWAGALALCFALSVAFSGTALGSFSAQRGKGLQPPPPPPFDSAELAKWSEVGPAKLAAGLALAEKGDLAGALAGLEALQEKADEEMKSRLNREIERLKGFSDFRNEWLRGLATGGKNFRMPLDGKMTAFKIDRVEEGDILFVKARKGVDRLKLAELSPSLMFDNLGKGLRKVEPTWIQAFLPSLGQREWDASKIAGLEDELLQDLDSYGWMLQLGALSTEIAALSAAGYPEGRAAQMALIDRLGAVNKSQGAIPALKGIDEDLKSYAGDLAGLAFQKANLGDLLKGKATDLGEGRWNVVYEFDNAIEAQDFYSIPDLFEFCLPEAAKPLSADKSGWLHNESALAWGGRVGLIHHVPFRGAMSAKYEWKASKIGKTFDIQGGNLIFGMAANPKKLSFIGQAFIHSAWCYQNGQLINHSNGLKPLYQNRLYKSEIERDAEGNVTTRTAGAESGKVSLPEVEVGPFFLVANLNIRGRIERLELEGVADEAGLEYLRKLRAFEHLAALKLDGREPERADME